MQVCIILIATAALFAVESSSSHVEMDPSASVPKNVVDLVRLVRRDLKLTVTHEAGNTVHQSVDDQQGQITDQFVSPDGIRQVVHRKGVVVLDQIVKTDGTVKQLVP